MRAYSLLLSLSFSLAVGSAAQIAPPGGVSDSLAFWVRADHGFQDADCMQPSGVGGRVVCWKDLSGHQRDALASGVATVERSARLAEKPVVRLSASHFQVPDLMPGSPGPQESDFYSPVTVFVVFDKPEEGGPYWQRVIASAGGGCADYQTASVTRTLGNADADGDNQLDALEQPLMFAYDYGGEERYYSRLQIGQVSRTIWSCVTLVNAYADIAEVALYNRVLEPAERGAVQNALMLRYLVGPSLEEDPAIAAETAIIGPLGTTGAALSLFESASSTDGQLEVTTAVGASAPLPDGLVHLYTERVWTLEPTDVTDAVAELSFDLAALDTDLPADFADVRILARASDTEPWRDVSKDDGVRLFHQRPIVTATGLAPSGQFALASTSVPVAVETDPIPTLALRVAPNPTQGSVGLAFELAAPGPVELAVVDLLGRRVASVLDGTPHTAGVHEARLDASALASGVYVIRLRAGNEQVTQRLTVVR
ncbi:MAG: hypothetical protein Rubg2KO_29610 [Rubricoccaceae bacterium]